MLPSATAYVHELVGRVVEPGGVAVDATAGNGHDTRYLAQLVGSNGHVHAIDTQEVALRSTRERLEQEGVLGRVTLHHGGHEHMADIVPTALQGRVQAVTFNLGYLPGGDSTLITRPETTLLALDAAVDLLAPGGLVTVVCYTGHAGALAEADAVNEWATALDQHRGHAVRYGGLNQKNRRPHAVVIERRTIDV